MMPKEPRQEQVQVLSRVFLPIHTNLKTVFTLSEPHHDKPATVVPLALAPWEGGNNEKQS